MSITATPVDSKFSNNLIVNDDKRNPFTVYDDVSGITFSNNSISAASKELKKGFVVDAAKIAKNDQGMVFDASGTYGASKSLKPIRKQDVGASWFVKSEDRKTFQASKTVKAGAGQNTIYDAVEQVEDGGIVELAAGDYVEAKTITINKTVTVKAAAGAKVNVEFYKKSLFEVVDGGSLQLEGLAISGASSPDDVGNAVVRTSRYSMLKNYRLELKSCEFTDLDVNRFFNVVSVSKSTLADNILLENVSVKKVTGSVLKLDLESDDYGIYNAEYVTIKNSQFEDVDGPLVTYYRGGTDESTFGPHFEMTGSTLKNVGNGSKNKLNASLYLHGVQVTAISNNKWLDSKPVIIEHTVGEPVTSVVDNTFVNTAKLDLQELYSKKPTTAVIKNNTYKK